jgi:hypothetical protein
MADFRISEFDGPNGGRGAGRRRWRKAGEPLSPYVAIPVLGVIAIGIWLLIWAGLRVVLAP